MKQIDCYVINMDRSADRRERIKRHFESLAGINLVRVPAFDAAQASPKEKFSIYCSLLFKLLNARDATNGEIGCFMSHLKAIKTFLDTSADIAIICEDDIIPQVDFSELATQAANHSSTWDLLRLGQNRQSLSFPYEALCEDYYLCTCVKGFAYAGAYMITRDGAQKILARINNICVPWDLALFHGWPEIREASLMPGIYTLDETSFQTTLGSRRTKAHPWNPLWWTALMYKIWSRAIRYSIQFWRVYNRRRK